MKQKSRARLSEADAYYAPSLFGDEISPPPDSGDCGAALLAKSKGYWVRRSEKQQVDKLGRPAGFRHELLLGGRVVEAGTGGNFGRSFWATATFLNSKQPRPHP